jgi:hypothetical protein
MTRINAAIEITALGFRNKKDQRQLESYPKRMVWGDREYNFVDMSMQYLVKHGKQLIKLFDVTDGNTLYRIRLEEDRWTLVGTSSTNLATHRMF